MRYGYVFGVMNYFIKINIESSGSAAPPNSSQTGYKNVAWSRFKQSRLSYNFFANVIFQLLYFMYKINREKMLWIHFFLKKV
jgi:hypothetical protein